MTDETAFILKTFEQYAMTFQVLQPAKVLPFHFPAMLISPKQVAVIGNPIVGYFGFRQAMKDLKRRCFTRSYAESLAVQKLSDNTATVTGKVIRLKQCETDTEETFLECCNLTYTMRKVNGSWKIIVGVLAEATCSSVKSIRFATSTVPKQH